MYPYPQSANPAARSHLDVQVEFFNALSQAMSRSFQQACQLNMQLSQTLFEEAAQVGQRMLTAERPTDALSAATARAQPTTDKLRAYQQHLSQLAADTQADLARVTEQHVPESSRTARALADEVARAAAEATRASLRQQEEMAQNFRDPFERDGARASKEGAQFQGEVQGNGDAADVSMKADGPAGHVSAQGRMQGTPAKPPVKTQPGQTR